MSGSRVVAIGGRIARQFRHDPRSVGLILIVPTVVMALVGYLVGDSGKEPLPVAVAVAGSAPTDQARALVERLDTQPTISATLEPSPDEARALVEDGDAAGAVVVEPASAGATTPFASVRVIVGGLEPGLDGRVIEAVRRALDDGGAGAGTAFAVDPVEGGAGLTTLDFFAPALIVVFGFLFTFMLTSVSFLRERSSGTLERLMASPATRLDLLVGYLLGFIGFAMLQGLVILGYAVFVLHVELAGAVWIVLLTIAILVIGVVNLGIALSFFARNELQVVQFIPLIFVPQVFLGGLFWPVQTLWPPLRYLSQAFPVTHAVVALREVMVGGAGFGDVAGRLAALLAFAFAMVGVGVLALRKQRA